MLRLRNYVTSNCLLKPSESSWYHFYRSATDQSFIAVTSLDRSSFNHLLMRFGPVYDNLFVSWKIGQAGRVPKLTDKHAILGLLLVHYSDQMGQKSLCQMFGIPPATVSRTLMRAEIALLEVLKLEPDARISWPSIEEQELWAEKINALFPLLRGRWGFVDGKNYRVQKPTSAELQNAMYNGWLHATFVTGCFVFGADGCCAWGKHNVVGSWNDGEISRPLQRKLQDDRKNAPNHGLVSDSAFPVSFILFY